MRSPHLGQLAKYLPRAYRFRQRGQSTLEPRSTRNVNVTSHPARKKRWLIVPRPARARPETCACWTDACSAPSDLCISPSLSSFRPGRRAIRVPTSGAPVTRTPPTHHRENANRSDDRSQNEATRIQDCGGEPRALHRIHSQSESAHGSDSKRYEQAALEPCTNSGEDVRNDHDTATPDVEGRNKKSQDENGSQQTSACVDERETDHLRSTPDPPDHCLDPESHEQGTDKRQANSVDSTQIECARRVHA